MKYIQNEKVLADVVAQLRGARLVAVDTEAAGYHRYKDTVCLLQLSTRDETFVIDALAVRQLNGLREILQHADTETVFHDADYDLRLLRRDFDLGIRQLFDTKIAAQFLGEPAIGLGALAEKYLGIAMEKKHQRADWAQRPLPADMLEYAAEDTRHLPALRDKLREALIAAGRLEWATEEFTIVQESRWHELAEESDAYLRIKGARELTPRQLAVLRELHAWRETAAEARDVATFRVIGNEALLELARLTPASLEALGTIKGVGSGLIDRRGTEMLAAIARGLEVPEDNLPTFPRGPRRAPPDANFEARLDRLRAARDAISDQLGLDRGFLMPRAQLEAIARLRPKKQEDLLQVPEIRRWQIAALGEKLLAAVAGR